MLSGAAAVAVLPGDGVRVGVGGGGFSCGGSEGREAGTRSSLNIAKHFLDQHDI